MTLRAIAGEKLDCLLDLHKSVRRLGHINLPAGCYRGAAYNFRR